MQQEVAAGNPLIDVNAIELLPKSSSILPDVIQWPTKGFNGRQTGICVLDCDESLSKD
jgi:hypothetical protein